jgi:hypothetical protein
MKILITTPSLQVPHGGTRILNEWAVRIAQFHDVTLLVHNGPAVCDWYDIPPAVSVTRSRAAVLSADCVIIGSPHSIDLSRVIRPKRQKCFVFMQMLEHMFSGQRQFQALCSQFYLSKFPMFHISRWNEEYVRRIGRKGEIHYVGNGVNLDHFPISNKKKDGKVVLVEGWECVNGSKDIDYIGAKVAGKLKSEGYTILAYGQRPLEHFADNLHEYYYRPSLEQMNMLYERATILTKASRYDARSTTPMEAMTKGTVTARAIIQGDDDLVHGENCLRCDYDMAKLYENAKELLTKKEASQTAICKLHCICSDVQLGLLDAANPKNY